jgi:hypothetical protein
VMKSFMEIQESNSWDQHGGNGHGNMDILYRHL